MIASSDRLILRKLTTADGTIFKAYRANPDVARFQSWEAMDDVSVHDFLQHMQGLAPLFTPGEWTQIAVASADSNELLGDMGLFLSRDERSAEIGITLAQNHWGQGLATEAVGLAVRFLFTNTQIERAICGADQRNFASLALIRRLGFTFTHTEPGMDPNTNDDMFALTREEWTVSAQN